MAVVSTSDRPAMERLKAAYVATAIAGKLDSGRNVLLLMDSVTRFARAQRELVFRQEAPNETGVSSLSFRSFAAIDGACRAIRSRLDHRALYSSRRRRRHDRARGR